ncbi:putative snf2 family helicase [Phaeomoniella chlamydospora]|uniref:Putative snf2 family helicase n=1 Tax=Phaeomoniella chlamydospora TaxID=158046 RepID=A0A0G2GQH4_PHACM|nr:putative snf2 family helicase [Phaeomoniella chlamydospora]
METMRQPVRDYDDDTTFDSYQLYGTLHTKIVGVRYYRGRANIKERILIEREPNNQYDRNAIRIDNVGGTQIGHIGRNIAAKLAPFLDSKALFAEGYLTGHVGAFDCPVALRFYGTSDPVASANLKKQMQDAKLPVSELIQAQKWRKKEESERAKQLKKQKSGAGMGGSGVQFDPSTGKYTNLSVPEGLGFNDASMEDIMAEAQPFNPREAGDVVNKFGSGEEMLIKLPMAEQPVTLKTKLLPYQLQGLQWMLDHESPELPRSQGDITQLWKRDSNGWYTNIATTFSTNNSPQLASGGILADDMGLGKTIEVISLIASQKHRSPGPTLIVSPLSVMSNWTTQAATHVKEAHALKVLVYHGSGREISSPKDLQGYDIVVTTYNTMGLDYFPTGGKTPVTNPQKKGLYSITWRRVVLDEGHVIRNPKAKMSQAAHALMATSRWVLSGTPIVNNLRDLYSHVKFLHLTGGLELFDIFNGTLIRPLKQGDPDARLLLQALMSSICLRRMKSMKHIDLKLPELSSHKYPIKFLPHERKKYDAFESEAKGLLLKVQEKRAQAGLGNYSTLLEVLLRMRQTCNHWKLCGDRLTKLLSFMEQIEIVDTNNSDSRRALQEVLQLRIESQEECSVCLETLHNPVITHCKHSFGRECIEEVIRHQGKCPLCRADLNNPAQCLVEPAVDLGEDMNDLDEIDMNETSSKIEALIQILKASAKKAGSKTVVFSQWTTCLDIVEKQLSKHGFKFTRLDGKMSVTRRDEAIASLDHDPECTVMLASLAVCGVGLNLVSANQVILMDTWWAPAIEDQAVDRVHRLGQTRPTTVFRLVMQGSIEEQVLEVQNKKRKLAATAFQEEGHNRRGQERESRLRDIETLLGG